MADLMRDHLLHRRLHEAICERKLSRVRVGRPGLDHHPVGGGVFGLVAPPHAATKRAPAKSLVEARTKRPSAIGAMATFAAHPNRP